MRMIVIKQATDLASVLTRLQTGSGDKDAGLQHLQRLNPHVDTQRIQAGTVLLVPDTPAFAATESSSVSGQAFDGYRAQLGASLAAAATRLRQGQEAQASDRQDLAAVLKAAAVRRLADADPDLKPQFEAATLAAKQDLQKTKDADAAMKLLQDGALAELEGLAKLLS